MPAALAAWPGLQRVLETEVRASGADEATRCYGWTAAGGFATALARDQVEALAWRLRLMVG